MNNKIFLIIVIILNLMVLLGQLWPEGAPPFARAINIITLLLNLVIITKLLLQSNHKKQ